MKAVTSILLTILVVKICFSQNLDTAKLDRFFQTLELNDKFMGSVMVYKKGNVLYSKSIGYANIEMGKKATGETRYVIGSLSKTITATLVLKAVEEGKLNLAKNIEMFFPTIQNANQITIGNLLNHHSGIHNFTGDAHFMTWNTQEKTQEEMLSIIAKGGSDFLPGSKGQYSNSNYVLLSYILEQIYKEPYDSILHKKIVDPLQLEHLHLGHKSASENEGTHSYTYEMGWHKVPETDLSIPMGAGGIIGTTGDMARFLEALFENGVISNNLLEKMKKPINGYGMGLFEIQFHDKMGYGHDGRIDGFNTVFNYFPKEEIVYVLFSNATNYKLEDISDKVLSAVFHIPFEVPIFRAHKISSQDLLPYYGVYKSKVSPLVISISSKENMLLAHPQGQQVYSMDAIATNRFEHNISGVVLEFVPSQNSMIMTQGNQTIVFTRQE